MKVTDEQAELLVRIGSEMRALQRDYFRTNSQAALEGAKRAERRFDELLDEIRGDKAGRLFES